MTAFLISAAFFFSLNIFLTPLSIIVFYLFEVHFLFLFPLIIDKIDQPILTSIKQTYKVGIFNALVTVIPIACFMLKGLFNISKPFHNWHIGSLAILIWYQNEIRDRL